MSDALSFLTRATGIAAAAATDSSISFLTGENRTVFLNCFIAFVVLFTCSIVLFVLSVIIPPLKHHKTIMSAVEATAAAATAVERMDLDDNNNNAGGEKQEEPATLNPAEDANDPNHNEEEEEEDDVGSDDKTSTTSGEMEEDEVMTTSEAENKLIEATQCKDEGNTYFKNAEYDKAARAYRKGCNLLKKIRRSRTTTNTSQNVVDDGGQVQTLLLTLYSNLCMVTLKQCKFKQTIQFATTALEIDPGAVKVLYRRAMAYREMGSYDEAKGDLKQALAVEPNNAACKKELVTIKKVEEKVKTSQKKALAKAFSSDGFLYNDKEEADRKREERLKEEKKQQEELLKKRKSQWEDECVKRMANNEPAISFEEWEKEEEEKEKKRKKEEKKKREAEKKKREEERKARRQSSTDASDSSDDELTKEELEKMRGYKKTADGRTTSYFTRELSEEEKRALGDIAPKRIDNGSTTPEPITPMPSQRVSTGSAWNAAGTWEEKDTTEWCKGQLDKRLREVAVHTSRVHIEISEVDELTGEASVALTAGKKRYIFDFHAKLKYQITDLDAEKVIAKGNVRLPDICSTHHEELEVAFDAWKKRPSPEMEKVCTDVRAKLADEIRSQVKIWVRDFNAQY